MSKRHKHWNKWYKKPHETKQQRELRILISFVVLLVGIISFSYFLYTLIKPFLPYIAATIAIILAYIIYRVIRNILKKRKLTGELQGHLQSALKSMDSTSKTYFNEEEANKALVSILKNQGLDAVYKFRLKDGREVDAKVGNVLIEGKLAPTLDEIDRLIGQIQAYSQYRYKLNVVIYGRLNKASLNRLQQEIQTRYLNKVFLTYLKNARRTRFIPKDTLQARK